MAQPPTPPDERSGRGADAAVIGAAVGLAAACVLLAVVVVVAHEVVLILFAGVLLGVLLDAVAGGLARVLPVSRTAAARLTLALCVVGVAVAVMAFGDELVGRYRALLDHMPVIVGEVGRQLEDVGLGPVLDRMPPLSEVLREIEMDRLVTAASLGLAGWATGAAVALLVGIWLGLSPRRYIALGTRLLPRRARARALEVGSACHHALQLWLLGRLVDMAVLAALTMGGLWLVGLPYAVPLALFAGVMEFVPYIGPTLGLLPVVLTAAALPSPGVVEVFLLYVGLQTVQSYLVTPLIDQRSVQVPPAAGLATQALMATVAGALGVLVAVPLLVVAIVLVQALYLQDQLGERVRLLGEPGPA